MRKDDFMNENIMNICGIDCYEKDGTAYLRLETAARGLGFTRIASSGNEVVRWETVRKYLSDLGVPTSWHGEGEPTGKDGLPEFIPENIFYRLAMKAKNEAAEKFQAVIADKVIPEIRRTGGYGTKQGLPNMENLRALAGIIRAVDIPLAAQKSSPATRARQTKLLMDAYGLPCVPDYVQEDPWQSQQLKLEAVPQSITIEGNRITIGAGKSAFQLARDPA